MRPKETASQKVSKNKSKPPVGFPRKPLETGEALSRRTITLRAETEKSIESLVGPRRFSAFVQTALDNELQRERIDEWLAQQEAARGGKPLSTETVAFAQRAWQGRK
jgi:hypothetical protein